MIKTKQNDLFVRKQKTETRSNSLGQEKSTRKVGGGGLHCEKSSLRFEATNIHKMQLCTLHFFHVHYFIVLVNLLSKATPRREEGEN